MQHTSFDVYEYAECRIRMPDQCWKTSQTAADCGKSRSMHYFAAHTAWFFAIRAATQRVSVLLRSTAKRRARSGRKSARQARPDRRESEPEGVNDSAAADRAGPPKLQPVGREPDARGLCAALHRQERAQMVERPGGQHRHRRGLVPRARSDRRLDRHQLRLRQCHRRDPDRRRADLSDQHSDRLLRVDATASTSTCSPAAPASATSARPSRR